MTGSTNLPDRDRYKNILDKLNSGLYERNEVVRKTFLAAVAGESIFYLGPPGVAKSLISRRLKFVFKDITSFEYLMNRFSTPEEIFGPISIAKLRDHDLLERKVDNYLPTAHIAFLDEIWKAGPSIQNTLLTIVNERIYRNGSNIIQVPLIALIAASNELPPIGEGLEALWDRFIIRLQVDNVMSSESFKQLISDTSSVDTIDIKKELQISLEELNDLQIRVKNIRLPKPILEFIYHLREDIRQHNSQLEDNEDIIYVSDRRWKKIVKILRCSALINGRTFVHLMDCFLIKDMIWSNPKQIPLITEMIKDSLSKAFCRFYEKVDTVQEKIDTLKREIEKPKVKTVVKPMKETRRFTDEYNIVHLKISKTTGFLSTLDKSNQVQYVYNWDDRFNSDWLPQVGDKVGLCLKKMQHWKTVKVTDIDNVQNAVIFKVDRLEASFQIDTFTVEKEVEIEVDEDQLDTNINRIQSLIDQIQGIENDLNIYSQEKLEPYLDNIFVKEEKAEFILQQVDVLKDKLERLLLRVKELQFGLDQQSISNYAYHATGKIGE